jgi:hypothetical protein
MKPHVVDQATRLYADNLSLEAIGPAARSTARNALKKPARSSHDTHRRH